LLPGKSSDCGVTAKDNRSFHETVLWIARTGAPWRDLPPRYGHWHRVYVRYNRWSHKGVWERIFETVAGDPDLEYLMVDAALSASINMVQPQKNATRTSPRSISRRAEHKDSCRS